MTNNESTAPASAPQVLIKNVNVFDGNSDELLVDMDVLVEGELIKTVGPDLSADAASIVIDGTGKTMTPGLIDMHQHIMINGPDGLKNAAENMDFATVGAVAAQSMYAHLLMKGVTTIRDLAGNSLGLAKYVQNGVLTGPRIYSAGPALQPPGGHTDVGGWNQLSTQDESIAMGLWAEVSGRDEVVRQARWNFRKGAAFLKAMPGGGVSSDYDPLEVVNLTLDEMKAAVEIAEDQKTYVTVHAYRDDAVTRSLDAGVKCVEHNFLVSEETIIRMAEENIVLSLQGFMAAVAFAHPETVPWYTPEQVRKAKQVHQGAMQMIEWARQHNVFITSGSDMFAENTPISKKNITVEVQFGFTAFEALQHATGNAGKVLEMSGPARNPYREGPLGVIAEGAYADILLWTSDPTKDIMVLEDERKLGLIMKGGELYKNTLVSDTDPTYRPAPTMRISPASPEFVQRNGCCI
jgi:imidazolonepropionase-like amidohydrolase